MKAKVETVAEKLEDRPKTAFPQTMIDKELFELLREKKEERGLRWEEVLKEAGLDWLRKK